MRVGAVWTDKVATLDASWGWLRPPSRSVLEWASRGGALVAIVLAGTALVGWAAGVPTLTTFGSGLASMKVNTALGIFVGAAPILIEPRMPGVRHALAGLATLLGGFELFEVIFDLHFPIDWLLVEDPGPEHGRMSGATALGVLILGLSGLTNGGHRQVQRDVLAGMVLSIALIALLGYSYDVAALYEAAPFASLSLPTALALAAASGALLLHNAEAGFAGVVVSPGPGGAIVRLLLPAVLLVPYAAGRWWLEAERASTVGGGFAIALMVTFTTVALGALVLFTGFAIARLDQSRAEAEAKRVTAETDADELRKVLVEAQKMQAVGRMAGGMAHDFNNLLMVILTYVELLARDDESRMKEEGLQQIRLACERGKLLNSQLLLLGRGEQVEREPLHLDTLVLDMEPMLSAMVSPSVELSITLDASSAIVTTPPGAIEQVIMNLVVNARDAMDEGRIHVRTERVLVEPTHPHPQLAAAPGVYVLLRVEDDGHGMDAETRSRIFEPFFTTKDRGRGTGLGLAIVYGLVEQLDGVIRVVSEPNQGTTFDVYIPAAAEGTTVHPSTPHLDLVGDETILLAEDDEKVRRVIRTHLEARGYTVLGASNGTEALELLAEDPSRVDLLVMDVVMPELGGGALTEAAWELRPELPVLFMSGYADRIVVPEAILDAGARFVWKPVTPSGIAQKIRAQLDEGSSASSKATALTRR